MHRQVVLTALQGGAARVEVHQLDCLIVAPGSNQVPLGTPRQTVDGTLVMFGPLEEDGRLVRLVVVRHLRHARVLTNTQSFRI